MPIIKSAKKRVKVAAKAGARNSKTRRQLRDALKHFTAALQGGKAEAIAEAERRAAKIVDTAAKKNVIHKNKAARTKAKLAAQVKAKGVKPLKAATKKVAAKTTKKPAKKKA